MKREYYVYAHIRKDNGNVFYIGKGKDDRKDIAIRNEHHDEVAKKYGFTSEVIADNLTEQEAHRIEKMLIEKIVFEKGYGIDIEGYNNYDESLGKFLTNRSWGHEISKPTPINKQGRGKKEVLILNPNFPKEKEIIDFLDKQWNKSKVMKDILYEYIMRNKQN